MRRRQRTLRQRPKLGVAGGAVGVDLVRLGPVAGGAALESLAVVNDRLGVVLQPCAACVALKSYKGALIENNSYIGVKLSALGAQAAPLAARVRHPAVQSQNHCAGGTQGSICAQAPQARRPPFDHAMTQRLTSAIAMTDWRTIEANTDREGGCPFYTVPARTSARPSSLPTARFISVCPHIRRP